MVKLASIYKICNDTGNLLSYILDEDIRIQFEIYLELSDKLNKTSIAKCFHLLIKSVVDEISVVLSTNIGYLLQDISKNLDEIVPKGETALDMIQLRLLHEYMDGLEIKFKKLTSLIRFIKITKLEPNKNYQSLIDIRSRRKVFIEIMNLKNTFDRKYFESFFGPNFKYYDSTDEFIDFQIKQVFEETINDVFKGSRSRRNTYDKIHLYSCCVYSKKHTNHLLKFVTKDKIMLKGATNLLDLFHILSVVQLNQLLEKEIPQLQG
jgi:hypothetical protein